MFLLIFMLTWRCVSIHLASPCPRPETTTIWTSLIVYTYGTYMDYTHLPNNYRIFFTDAKELLQPGHSSEGLTSYYAFTCIMWLGIAFHDFIEIYRGVNKHKDRYVMLAHHVVTLALLGMSWAAGYTVMGNVVLFHHNLTDIFITILQLHGKYRASQRNCVQVYVITMLVWVAFRLVAFGNIVWSCLMYAPNLDVMGKVCSVCLSMLYTMHLYWTLLLLNIALSSKGKAETMESQYNSIQDAS